MNETFPMTLESNRRASNTHNNALVKQNPVMNPGSAASRSNRSDRKHLCALSEA